VRPCSEVWEPSATPVSTLLQSPAPAWVVPSKGSTVPPAPEARLVPTGSDAQANRDRLLRYPGQRPGKKLSPSASTAGCAVRGGVGHVQLRTLAGLVRLARREIEPVRIRRIRHDAAAVLQGCPTSPAPRQVRG
jgi:hypothetical protein